MSQLIESSTPHDVLNEINNCTQLSNYSNEGLGKLFGLGKEFTQQSTIHTLAEIFGTWLLLLATIGTYLLWPNPIFYCIAVFLIASRQYALMILMHDAFHSLLHPNRKINHFLGSILLAYPCGSAYWIGRSSHLAHHRLVGKLGDPDRDLYVTQGKESLSKLFIFLAKLPLGEQLKRTYGMTESSHFRIASIYKIFSSLNGKIIYLIPVGIFQLVILSIFYNMGSLVFYFTLWLLPLSLATIFNGIRIFCEHGNTDDTPGDKEHRLISYISHPVERFFISPFHMNYHAEHHLFPYVPHYNLPQLRHKILIESKLKHSIQWRQGYFSFLNFFLREVSAIEKATIYEK